MLYEPPIPSLGLDVGSPGGWARITALSDPRDILEAFYRETLQLSESAIKDLANREFPYLAGSIRHTAGRELAQTRAYRLTERHANITTPVRMLLGTESPAYLRAATAVLAAKIPGATIVALHGQGHQAIDYDPDQFARAVLEFDSEEVDSGGVGAVTA